MITGGRGSLCVYASAGLLDSHLAVFTPLLRSSLPDRLRRWSSGAGLQVDPVGRSDGTVSSLPSDDSSAQNQTEDFFSRIDLYTERKQQTARRFGAQRDGPTGRKGWRWRDEEGHGVGGGGVIAAVCRPIRRFLSCLRAAVASSLRLFYLSPWCVSLSSVLRAAPGVTPFPLVGKWDPPQLLSFTSFSSSSLSIRQAARRRGGADECAWGQVKENEGIEGGAPRGESSSPLCCLSAGRGGCPSWRLGGRYKGGNMRGRRWRRRRRRGCGERLQRLKQRRPLLL